MAAKGTQDDLIPAAVVSEPGSTAAAVQGVWPERRIHLFARARLDRLDALVPITTRHRAARSEYRKRGLRLRHGLCLQDPADVVESDGAGGNARAVLRAPATARYVAAEA